jgi:hypothetical protein
VKSGARHSSKDVEMVQKIHDLAVSLGAKCAEVDDSGDADADEGKAEGDIGKPSAPAPKTYAARIAIDLIEAGVTG